MRIPRRRAGRAGGADRHEESQQRWAQAVADWAGAAEPLREAWQRPEARWLVEVWEWSLWSRGGWAYRDGPLPPLDVAAAVVARLGEELPSQEYAALVAVDERVLATTALAHLPEADVAARRNRLRGAAAAALTGLHDVADAEHDDAAATWNRVDDELRALGVAHLDVEQTLGQARWWPARDPGGLPPYRRPDPLGLAVGRRLMERGTEHAAQWHALLDEAHDRCTRPVEPVGWLLTSTAYAARRLQEEPA